MEHRTIKIKLFNSCRNKNVFMNRSKVKASSNSLTDLLYFTTPGVFYAHFLAPTIAFHRKYHVSCSISSHPPWVISLTSLSIYIHTVICGTPSVLSKRLEQKVEKWQKPRIFITSKFKNILSMKGKYLKVCNSFCLSIETHLLKHDDTYLTSHSSAIQ